MPDFTQVMSRRTRPALMAEVSQVISTGGTPFAELERAISAYLDAEKDLGRIAPAANTQMIAFTSGGAREGRGERATGCGDG